jgi:hypothetical protein
MLTLPFINKEIGEIKIINNIFTEDQRKKLIDDVQPLMVDGVYLNNYYGIKKGYQEGFNWFRLTYPTVHLHPDFDWAFDIILSKVKKLGFNFKKKDVISSWMNLTNGSQDKGNLKWHDHKTDADYVVVYYIKMFPFFSNGTLFKDYGLVKAKQNSMLLFPSHLDHATPSSPLRFERYSWSINLGINKNT